MVASWKSGPNHMPHENNDAKLTEDLQRRIDELQDLDDSAFGSFTRLDWVVLIFAAVVLPTLAMIAAR